MSSDVSSSTSSGIILSLRVSEPSAITKSTAIIVSPPSSTLLRTILYVNRGSRRPVRKYGRKQYTRRDRELTFYTSALQLGSNTSAPLCQGSVSGWIEQVAFSSTCLSRARELIDGTYGITRRKHGNRCLLYTTLLPRFLCCLQ